MMVCAASYGMNYKPTIGLEIHAELKTKTKMFCGSINDPDEKHPNVNVCPICMGHPGTLPVINRDALDKIVLAGLALNCTIQKESFFERKNYFYPDLPKGYQISQYLKPFCENGYLEIKTGKKIKIERIHLEEDAGRLSHTEDGTLVDYNRAGVPLMELVTKPDLETGADVKAFAEELQLILRYLGVSDADMEKGLMRVEVNISVSKNEKLGTKVEIKNLNSIKSAATSVEYELKRQSEALDRGEKIIQETRGWDDKTSSTFSQRSKEEAHDYRYFPEPDLPPIKFTDDYISSIKSGLPELPSSRRTRFKKEYKLPESDIEIFTLNKKLGNYFEQVISELLSFEKLSHLKNPGEEHQEKLIKLASNYIITELQKLLYEISGDLDDLKISPESFADFIVRVFHKEVSSTGAQTLLKEMFLSGDTPEHIIGARDLAQVSEAGELSSAIESAIMENPKPVEDYKKGKKEALKFLVGRIMAATRGKANPEVVSRMLEEKLK